MMDLTATTNRAPQAGETVTGIKFQTAPGGKGANQAVQCARLGAQVSIPREEEVYEFLKKEGIRVG